MAICMCATNYHVSLHPLRNVDGDAYRRWMCVIRQEAIEIAEKKYAQRKRSREKYKLRNNLTPERPGHAVCHTLGSIRIEKTTSRCLNRYQPTVVGRKPINAAILTDDSEASQSAAIMQQSGLEGRREEEYMENSEVSRSTVSDIRNSRKRRRLNCVSARRQVDRNNQDNCDRRDGGELDDNDKIINENVNQVEA